MRLKHFTYLTGSCHNYTGHAYGILTGSERAMHNCYGEDLSLDPNGRYSAPIRRRLKGSKGSSWTWSVPYPAPLPSCLLYLSRQSSTFKSFRITLPNEPFNEIASI